LYIIYSTKEIVQKFCKYVDTTVEENCRFSAYDECIFGQMTVPAHYGKDALRAGDTYVTTTPVGYQLMGTKRSLAPRQAGWLADRSLTLLWNPSCATAASNRIPVVQPVATLFADLLYFS
jgi:hypothetical protein